MHHGAGSDLPGILARYRRDWQANGAEGREALDLLTAALAHAADELRISHTSRLFNGYVTGYDDPDVRAFTELVGEPYEALMSRTQTSLSPEELAYVGFVRFIEPSRESPTR